MRNSELIRLAACFDINGLSNQDMEFLHSVAAELFPEGQVPDWIRNHPAIKNRKIKKVFPLFGLSNFIEPANIPISEIAPDANDLWIRKVIYSVNEHINAAVNRLEDAVYFFKEKVINAIYKEIEKKRSQTEINTPEYKQLSKDLWNPEAFLSETDKALIDHGRNIIDLLLRFENIMDNECFEQLPDGRGKFVLRDPISYNGKTIGTVGENVPRVYGKIKKITDEYYQKIAQKDLLPDWDNIHDVKIFNARNFPIKKENLNIVFSGSGEKGAWDIATMSMRGISSCQSWDINKEQNEWNACIIGSIASRYVGVIYLTSGHKYENMGTRMLKRCVVRFGVDMRKPKKERTPVIILDVMYDYHSPIVAKAFIDAIKKRTSLPVLDFSNGEETDSNEGADIENVYLPAENLPNVFDKSVKFSPDKNIGYKSYKDIVNLKELNKEEVKKYDSKEFKTNEQEAYLDVLITSLDSYLFEDLNQIGSILVNHFGSILANHLNKKNIKISKIIEIYRKNLTDFCSAQRKNDFLFGRDPKFVTKYVILYYIMSLHRLDKKANDDLKPLFKIINDSLIEKAKKLKESFLK